MLSILEERGYVKEIAGDRNALDDLFTSKRIGAYAGIDPTAPSLHLGHLLPLMVLYWLYVHGYHVVSLIGGATAKVGDPTGRLTSRASVQGSVHQTNLVSMHMQMKRLWENAEVYASKHGYQKTLAWKRELLNNASWMNRLSVVEFLRLMGAGARMGTMLSRDTVKNKMTQGDGMSFAEFTYPLLQAWDWWHMYSTKGVQLQIGGSDQYGNIIAGIDGIKHTAAQELDPDKRIDLSDPLMQPMGLTVPLLTTSSGAKFGKSAGNAVWLDKDMTSSFDLYGFLLRSNDADVERYLKLFTFLPLTDVSDIMEAHAQDPSKRHAQHALAYQVLWLVHGAEEAERTSEQHRLMRRPTLSSLTSSGVPSNTNLEHVPGDAKQDTGRNNAGPTRTMLPRSLVQGTPLSRVLYHVGLAKTRSEGQRLILKGGAYVGRAGSGFANADGKGGMDDEINFRQISDANAPAHECVSKTGLLLLRVGKWKVRVVEVVDDEEFDARGGTAPGWEEWKDKGNAKEGHVWTSQQDMWKALGKPGL